MVPGAWRVGRVRLQVKSHHLPTQPLPAEPVTFRAGRPLGPANARRAMPLDPAALAAHRHRVYAFALRLTGCREDAADVTQEVLVRLWRHGDAVEAERRTAWVLRVTRNAAFDLLRRRQTRAAFTVTNNDLPDRAPADGHAPDTLAESADWRRHLHEALDALDEPYRSIVLLREVEDLPYQAIADALDLPLNTLKVYLHRARRRLRDALRERLPAEDLAL